MVEAAVDGATQRYALVTGGNKGIGFEICRQLASKGIVVILTSRDENRGTEAVERLKESGLSDHVVFHQLDVVDAATIAAVVQFVTTKYGRLDILVSCIMHVNLVSSPKALFRQIFDISEQQKSAIFMQVINAGTAGIEVEGDVSNFQELIGGDVAEVFADGQPEPLQLKAYAILIQTYEGAEESIQTSMLQNESRKPLFLCCNSPRIVNVSSLFGHLKA